jgi:hypothetical protein
MKKTSLLVLLIFNITLIFSQKKELKNRLTIKIGTEYRITPIHKTIDWQETEAQALRFNLDKNLSGTSFNYEINYEVIHNLLVGFSHSLRYDHVYYENNNHLLKPNGIEFYTIDESKSKLISDYHFFIQKNFKLKKNKIYIKLGYSMMNRGTDYSVSEVVSTNLDGSIGAIISGGYDLNFFATNVNIGIIYKKFDFGVGAYFINGSSSNLGDERNIILPYFKISYRIF